MLNNIKSYFDALSRICVICALTVLLHHILFYFNSSPQLLAFQLNNGAVTLFFVFGFVLYYRYGQQKTFNLKDICKHIIDSIGKKGKNV